jgi:hypothetical protein
VEELQSAENSAASLKLIRHLLQRQMKSAPECCQIFSGRVEKGIFFKVFFYLFFSSVDNDCY